MGGLESVVRALAIGHHQRGHKVSVLAVLSTDQGDHAFVDALNRAGVEVAALRLGRRAYLEEKRRIGAYCRQLRPQILHSHGYRSDVLAGAAARRLGIPTVTTVHGFTGGGWKNRFYEWAQGRTFRRFDAVVAVSRPLMQRLQTLGVPLERIHLLPNAWAASGPTVSRSAARELLGVPDGRYLLGWVGRLSKEKGCDVLLDALALLADIPFQLAVLGDGRERSELEARAANLGIGDRVRWHGTVADASRLFPAFDAFVLSSRTEGTPIVLFEAMAAGVPVVATAVGGVPDVVSSSEATLIPPEDPRALADALRAGYRDPSNAHAKAAAAHQRLAADFSVNPWLSRYETLYGTLLPPTPARSR